MIYDTSYISNWPYSLRNVNHGMCSLKIKYLGTKQLIKKIQRLHKLLNTLDYADLVLRIVDSSYTLYQYYTVQN